MQQQYTNENNNRNGRAAAKVKKAGKILGITCLCMVAFIVVSFGVIIYKGMYPAKGPTYGHTTADSTEVNNTETSFDETESGYIDVPTYNEFQLYAANSAELPIALSNNAYASLLESLSGQGSEFRMSEYFALDQTLNMYHNTAVDKSTETTLLTNGLLDADKLIQTVNRNNNEVMPNNKNTLNAFYTKLDDSDIALICEEICKVVNATSDEFDINQIANTLENLTIFQKTGMMSNAAITTELAFVYNPIMTENYGTMLRIKGHSEEYAWERVIDHEIMHLIQYSASDNNKNNGIEIGISRMYNIPYAEKGIPVDSLYCPWLQEAAAELGMANYLDIEPGTYEKKISYVTSYNLSRFYENSSAENALEKVGFKHTLEEAFAALGLETESKQLEFLNFMYSIEITQSDPEDFWEYYESQTGKALTDDAKFGIRMDIRTDAVKYMTENFFANLITAIHEGAIADLDTAFYLMRLWELDTFNHLNYTEESSVEHATDFIIWYNQTQTAILSAIAESSNLDSEQVQTMYSEYRLQLDSDKKDNCDLRGLNAYMQDYILDTKNSYRSSNYSRIYDVAKWLEPILREGE